MSLDPVSWLCKGARDLPKEVKRQIAYYGRHPTACLLDGMVFKYGPVAYEPLSKFLHLTCPYPTKWLWLRKGRRCVTQHVTSFLICRSMYTPDYNELPAWVVDEMRSPDQEK